MKVYIVHYSYYDDFEILGVFSTLDKAESYLKILRETEERDIYNYAEGYDWSEWELDCLC